ncbi:MAG: biotin--[acetyl-CoA-carboxylase] ligase [Candidatus Cloacimonetes bacterium]|nr:biotin--[acetyl-CoA-carboxylase] ligase [Candidatus Cloacimonadota bacterium]
MKDFKHQFFDEVLFYDKIASTSVRIEKLITSNMVKGNVLCIAGEQTSGKGRSSNNWFSPLGGLWFTAALYGFDFQSNITIFTGICIHKVITTLFPETTEHLKIKWPNDIFLEGKKLGGILSHNLSTRNYHLLGIGLNTNVSSFDYDLVNNSTSITSVLKHRVDNQRILTNIFDLFTSELPDFVEGKFDLEYFNKNTFLKEKIIELDTKYKIFKGIVKGINRDGALLLEIKPGMIQPFYAGNVISWENGK